MSKKIAHLRQSEIEALDRIDYDKLAKRLNNAKQPLDGTQYTSEMCKKLTRNLLCIATNVNGYTPPNISQDVPDGLEYAIVNHNQKILQNMLNDIDGWQIQE